MSMNNDEQQEQKKVKQPKMFDVQLPRLEWTIHPTSMNISFVRNCFRIYGKVTCGITTGLLSRSFYPTYDFKTATYPSTTMVCASSGSSSPKMNPFWLSTAKKQRAGMNRGKRLDNGLGVMLGLIHLYKLPRSIFNISPEKKAMTLKQCINLITLASPYIGAFRQTAGGKKLRTVLNSKQPHARLLWTKLSELGMHLIATQVTVGIPDIGATNLDGIVMNSKNQLIPIEIKSGGSSYFHLHTNHMMKYPFNDMDDSKYNQALLQLGIGTEFYCHTFPQNKEHLTVPLLFRITHDEVHMHPLPSSISSRLQEAIKVLKTNK